MLITVISTWIWRLRVFSGLFKVAVSNFGENVSHFVVVDDFTALTATNLQPRVCETTSLTKGPKPLSRSVIHYHVS